MYYSAETTDNEDREVTIRSAGSEEWDAIDRLAQLDSAPPPPRDAMLVAEVGGEVRAAVSVMNGYAIADPFIRSDHLLELLRARAAQVRDGAPEASNGRRRGGVGSLAWLRLHRTETR